MCIDATKINKCFTKLPISMPLISDITAELSRYPYKAVIDLKWAFTHLPLSPAQRKFFGFATPIGSFRFKRAPFGFINSPANQQFFMVRKIDRPFKLKWKDLERFIESYIDDIHLGAMSLIELLEMIYEILEQLVRLNCSVVPTSIQFGRTVEALGQLVSERGTTIEERHKEAIAALKPATSPKSWKSLNAFLSYFRGYVLHFSARAKAIRECAAEKRKSDSPEAIAELKDVVSTLLKAPSLRRPPLNARIILETDYSKDGFGAVLYFDENGSNVLSRIMSRRTTVTESKLSAIDGEASAVLWALFLICHFTIFYSLLFLSFSFCCI